ncbi:MAG: hypothetical protein Q9214_001584 [Letrouitia sp. 1 TL-2023]
MTRILLIGATGYVGSALASELLRSGLHTVYGLARSSEKAAQLAAKEIIPVLVDCAGANNGSAEILRDLVEAGKERLKAGGAKLGFVYCSGMWVHGSSFERISDLDPVGTVYAKTQPPRLVAWRPQLEREILASRDVLDVAIVRPAEIYGREHGLWNPLFGPILEATKSNKKSVQLPLGPTGRPCLIHIDDVASGFRCKIEKLELISGTGVYPVFNLVTSYEPISLVVTAAADAIGFQGEVKLVAEKENVFGEAMATSINDDSSRAKHLLGWKPKRIGFVGLMDIYIRAWPASQPSP